MSDTVNSVASSGESLPSKSNRLVSLDALRGFDMFCIVGGESIIAALQKVNSSPILQKIGIQMEHVAWEGFHFEDLLFPMFVFISGVSLVFSLSRVIEQEGKTAAVWRIVKRALLLYALGFFYYGGFGTPFEKIRLMGVLQRFAIATLFAGLIFTFLEQRGRVIACVGILIGYWILLTFAPVPGIGAGHFEEGMNLTNWVDKMYLPLRKWDGDHDPEGLLSNFPAVATCLLGMFAGVFLKNEQSRNKVLTLLIAGVISLALGYAWSYQFPIIKKLWTSSFVLVAGGYSLILLALFYQVIDVWKLRGWAQPFIWVGMNSISIYMIHNVMDIGKLAQRFVGGDLSRLYLKDYGSLVLALMELAITVFIAWWMYSRKIFIKL